jgi:hypothetical protein
VRTLYFTFLYPGLLRLYDGDRIGLRILLLSSLDRSDFRDLARVKVTEVFDELEIAHHDELLDDIGTIHPFCVRIVGLGRTRGNGPTSPLARTLPHGWRLRAKKTLCLPATFALRSLIRIKPDFFLGSGKRSGRRLERALCENVRAHGPQCPLHSVFFFSPNRTITPDARHRWMDPRWRLIQEGKWGSCACLPL